MTYSRKSSCTSFTKWRPPFIIGLNKWKNGGLATVMPMLLNIFPTPSQNETKYSPETINKIMTWTLTNDLHLIELLLSWSGRGRKTFCKPTCPVILLWSSYTMPVVYNQNNSHKIQGRQVKLKIKMQTWFLLASTKMTLVNLFCTSLVLFFTPT